MASPRDVLAAFGSVWVADGPAANVIRIDPTSGAVQASISVPDPASVLAAGEGAVWLTSYPGNSLTRIDPTTNRATRTLSLAPAGSGPVGLVVADGFVWVANHDGSPTVSISKVDARTMRVADVIKAGDDTQAGPVKVVSAGGNIWTNVAGRSVVLRLDPRTDRVVETVKVDAACADLVANDSTVWLAGGAAGDGCAPEVVRIDAATGAITGRIDMPGDTAALAVDPSGDVWAGVDASLVRVSQASGTTSGRWILPGSPSGEAFADGYLWVTDRENAVLYKVSVP